MRESARCLQRNNKQARRGRAKLGCGPTCPSTASKRNYARHVMSTMLGSSGTVIAREQLRLPVGNDTGFVA
jgi:hypothetical protein